MKSKQASTTVAFRNTDPQDLLCFSHLKWNFVYQRPQHIMSRFTKKFRVFYIEEPCFHTKPDSYIITKSENVNVVKFLLNEAPGSASLHHRQQLLLDRLMADRSVINYLCWYYTPMALKFSSHLCPQLTIYDCMDELSAFKFAPSELKQLEISLFKRAQLVFTGGHSLYEAKKHLHHNIYPFPSSIDRVHFAKGKNLLAQPSDQANVKGKKIGFYGVIDERFDIELVKQVATMRPDWQLMLIGPVVKIDENTLPRLQNIHYLGAKTYNDLPVYLSGWDIAMIPFAKNKSTQFISPTKTPEYLAAGKPVISTSITDVVNPYGINNLVHIADTPEEFVAAAEKEFSITTTSYNAWLEHTEEFLSTMSWDITTRNMLTCIEETLMNANANNKLAATGLKSVA